MSNPHQAYLETQIFTATPQKLRLMLIEGGIRFARQAQAAFEKQDLQTFLDYVARCRDITTELLVTIKQDGHEITIASRGIYAFLVRTLADVELQHNASLLNGVLQVLEEERITWQKVCELEPHAPENAGQASQALGASSLEFPIPFGTAPGSQLSFDA